ncbi:MAG: YIP1 family protein [Candidatus Schekmanbacteria bacterium]|nr:YIP1 family protein [Candidatus Schekmanbacteria bacterium]
MPTSPDGPPAGDLYRNALARLATILFFPRQTFQSIRSHPTIAVPIAAWALAGALLNVVSTPRIDWDAVIRANIQSLSLSMPEAEIQRHIADASRYGIESTVMSTLISMPLGYLIMGAALWVALGLLGKLTDLKTAVSVMVHSQAPQAAAMLLSIPVVLRVDKIGPELVRTGSYLPSNLAAVFGTSAGGPLLQTLLTSVDLFSVWSAILLAFGLVTAMGLRARQSAQVVVMLWASWVTVKALLTVLNLLAGGRA